MMHAGLATPGNQFGTPCDSTVRSTTAILNPHPIAGRAEVEFERPAAPNLLDEVAVGVRHRGRRDEFVVLDDSK
ncbi:hypothetical protein C449_00225 [Halococcus saccharolyticus DSM 5350]|uniref:Uncharacterized protein n=1 Tax=Halococcus saccharolyticus DSM 5350 TaxID=1227455 RepID=M0MQD6_9EURY|nr:hypothetical protein C449_00225 [Halococcus saccharolyticus DSM 5350]